MVKKKIVLKDGENGYDVVAEYIKRYWEHEGCIDNVLITLSCSYYEDSEIEDNITSEFAYHIFYPDDITFSFLNDWWEGEKYITIYGIKNINKIRIYGGIYQD